MKISKLQKKIGQFTLQIEELYLESGKVHGLIGTNGCGKTTLSKLIQGILVPDGGRIDYEGLTPRDITMTTQRPYLLHDTVYQNLIYPLKIRGIRPDEAKMDAWLERCGLLQKKNQYARSLSSGEQQKLSFIRALCRFFNAVRFQRCMRLRPIPRTAVLGTEMADYLAEAHERCGTVIFFFYLI